MRIQDMASATTSPPHLPHQDPLSNDDEYRRASRSRFRFKSSSKPKRPSHRDERSLSPSLREADEVRPRKHRHRDRSERRHKHSRHSRSAPAVDDDFQTSDASPEADLDPEVAFRESLFDAMADDEGASFWEGVYGQPIHTYPNVKAGPTGELEQMTDDEYAQYVRAKMWEKTHQGLLEEKKRREEARKEKERLAKEGKERAKEGDDFMRKVEESLKRGGRRRERKEWEEWWNAYVRAWDQLGKGEGEQAATGRIPWPVRSGKAKDAHKEEIKQFFLNGPTGGQPTETSFVKTLKIERVRWHPDKIQQRLGGQGVDPSTMANVTAVFQIIDQMWSEARGEKA